MNTRQHLLTATAFFLTLFTQAQNTSPYWSLAGNSNAAASSKLGTTNLIPLNLVTNNATRLHIGSTGNVGIGTTSPETKLHIVETATAGSYFKPLMIYNPNLSTGQHVQIGFGKSNSTFNQAELNFNLDGGAGSPNNSFSMGLYGKPTILTLKGTGNVGIGTSNPSQSLHVVGNQLLSGNLTFANSLQSIQFANPEASSNAMMYMFSSGTSNADRMVISHSPAFSSWGLQYDDGADRFDFLGAGSSRLAIELGSGNVGIGNNTPLYKLDVNGRIRLRAGGGSAGLWLSNNTNTSETGFMGVFDDNNIGLWGNTGAGWGLTMNTTSGDVNLRGDGRGLVLNNGQYIRDGAGATDDIEVHGDLVPDTDGFHNLGSDALTWSSVWAVDQTINTSDARLKKNIENSPYGLKEILKLRPVTYHWNSLPDDSKRIGLIAQEVQKIIPEMVKDSRVIKDHETGTVTKVPTVRLGLQYDALIPVLTKAIQEQQQQIEAQQQQINELKQLVDKLVNGLSINTREGSVALLQNVPNPARSTTRIQYSLPQGSTKAQLQLTDALGRTVKTIQLTSSGVVNLDVSTLSSGVYAYSIVVEGKALQTKKLTVGR